METQLYNKLLEEGGKKAWDLLLDLTGGHSQSCINKSANVRTRYVMNDAHRREGYNEALLALAEKAQGRDREILLEAAAASLKRQWDHEKRKTRLFDDDVIEQEYRKLRCCSNEIYKFKPPKEMNDSQKERLEQGRSPPDPITIQLATLLKMRDQAARVVRQFVKTGSRKLLYPAAKALQLLTGRRTEEICNESTFAAVSNDQPYHMVVSDVCKKGTPRFGASSDHGVSVIPCLGVSAQVVAQAVDLIQGMNYLKEPRGRVLAASTAVWGKGNKFEQPLLREWYGKLAWFTRDEHRWNENLTERKFLELVRVHEKGSVKPGDLYDKTVVLT